MTGFGMVIGKLIIVFAILVLCVSGHVCLLILLYYYHSICMPLADEIDGSGFEYAFDFPRHYSGKRGWFSNVRRRRWIRIRRLRSADDGTEMEASSRSGDHSKSVSDGNVVFLSGLT